MRGQSLSLWENPLSVVKIDERGRVLLPRELREADRAVVIAAGSYALVIPVPAKPEEHASGWLATKHTAKELKALAEEGARKDALARAKRRRQL